MMSPLDELRTARIVAYVAHAGQLRSDKEPYIEHVRRVVGRSPVYAKAAAWLHDVVEDSLVSFAMLEDLGFSHPTIEAVRLLTRPVFQHSSSSAGFDGVYGDQFERLTPYAEYVQRIIESGSRIAIAVKIADVQDHLSRPAQISDSLTDRYRKALEALGGEDPRALTQEAMSAQPCGCDPGAGWTCSRHSE